MNRKTKRSLKSLYFILLATLPACTQIGHDYYQKNTQKIRVCETTKAEVLKWFGEPQNIGYKREFQTLQWWFAKDRPWGDSSKSLVVFVNRKKIVVDYYIDPEGIVNASEECRENS